MDAEPRHCADPRQETKRGGGNASVVRLYSETNVTLADAAHRMRAAVSTMRAAMQAEGLDDPDATQVIAWVYDASLMLAERARRHGSSAHRW